MFRALRRRPLATLLLCTLLGWSGSPLRAHAQVGGTQAPLIQGTPSLVEPFDATAPAELAAVAAETQAALMLTTSLTLTETTAIINPTPTLGELWQLCDGQAFEEQPTAAFCSGTLIAPDLLLTAEHCVPNKRSCQALSVVFDYRYSGAGVMSALERDDVYACSRILASDGTGDYALIRLDRAVVGRAPAQVHLTDPSTCLGVDSDADEDGPDRVWAAGFPSGVPLKLDVGDAADGIQVENDSVTSRRFFLAGFDLFAGMDGGGVFNQDLALVGFLTTGRADYERTDTGCFEAVQVDDTGRELAGHVVQPLIPLCNGGHADEYPDLCPATVHRCPRASMPNADAGVVAFPPSQGCGCRVPAHAEGPHGERAGLGLVVGFLLLVGARARRRQS